MKDFIVRGLRYIIILVAVVHFLCFDTFAQSRQNLESEKARLEKEISSMNAILKQTKQNKKLSASELQVIRKKVEQRQQLVNNITSQINMLNSQIRSTQQNIGETYRSLQILKQNYAQMLRYCQKNKTATDRLLFIFAAKDYRQAYQRYVYFRKFGILQRQQILLIQQKTKQLGIMSEDLLKQKQSHYQLLSQEKANAETLIQERKQQEKVVQTIKQQEKQLSKQIQQAQNKKRKLVQQINLAIQEEVKKQQQLVAKQNKNKSAKSSTAKTSNSSAKSNTTNKSSAKSTSAKEYTLSANSVEVGITNGFEKNKGRLPWPVDKSVVVSGFGVHEHPDIKGVQIENLGVDIRSTKGSAVRSVYEGEVCKVWTGPNGNKIVIVRHGDYMTVYTNLESTVVRDGTKVTMGQKLGTIATNENGQSEMNFQVRKGVKCQNPSIWLKRK